MPRVDDPAHAELQASVIKYVSERGFHTSEKTYHDGHIPREIIRIVALTFTPTALFYRSSADRINIHPGGFMFYNENKTIPHGRTNLVIEALPLADHMYHARRGVLCLYCCRDHQNVDRGFWAHSVPPIACVFLPKQRKNELTKWYRETLAHLYPGHDTVELSWVAGSGDPFVKIDELVIEELPSWQQLIDCAFAEFERSRNVING